MLGTLQDNGNEMKQSQIFYVIITDGGKCENMLITKVR